MWICQNSLNCILRSVHFTVCKLYLNKNIEDRTIWILCDNKIQCIKLENDWVCLWVDYTTSRLIKIFKLEQRYKIRTFRKCIRDMSNRVKSFNKCYSVFQKKKSERIRKKKYLIRQHLLKSSQSWEKQFIDPRSKPPKWRIIHTCHSTIGKKR